MSRRLGILILLVACAGSLRADEASQNFEEGNQLYLQGKYADAAAKYERIFSAGFESGELHYNLGNAYYKSGRIQNAILEYERAKEFFPRDEDLLFNLQLANLQIVDKIDVVPRLFVYRWADTMLTLFSLSTMGWIVYVFFLLTLGAFTYFLFAPSYVQKRLALFSGLVCSALLVLTMAGYAAQSFSESSTEYAIIMSDTADIKSAPDSRGNDLFVLHKGLKIQVLDSVNHWRKIRLADGKVGWIPEEDCEVI